MAREWRILATVVSGLLLVGLLPLGLIWTFLGSLFDEVRLSLAGLAILAVCGLTVTGIVATWGGWRRPWWPYAVALAFCGAGFVATALAVGANALSGPAGFPSWVAWVALALALVIMLLLFDRRSAPAPGTTAAGFHKP